MFIPTIPGGVYAVTAAVSCLVSAVRGNGTTADILTIDTPGQYLIVAPTGTLSVTDETALVTPAMGRAILSQGPQKGIPSNTISEQDRLTWNSKADGQAFTDHCKTKKAHFTSGEAEKLAYLLTNSQSLLDLLDMVIDPPVDPPSGP